MYQVFQSLLTHTSMTKTCDAFAMNIASELRDDGGGEEGITSVQPHDSSTYYSQYEKGH